MHIKKYILTGGTIAGIVSGALLFVNVQGAIVPSTPSADSGAMMEKKMMTPPDTPRPMVLQVGANGHALLRGKVKTVGTSSLTVNTWGGDWTINVSAATTLMPQGVTLEKFKADDFVGIQGWVNGMTGYAIDADLVRNWTERQELHMTRQENRQEVRDVIKDLSPRNWQGTFKSLVLDAFVLTIDGTDYTVALAPGAKIYNQQYLDMNLADIKAGHTVRFYGTVSGTTATAYVVRDISVGARTNL